MILNERVASYVQDLQIALETLVRTSQSRRTLAADGARGSVFILRADLISAEARDVSSGGRALVLVSRRGSLADQLDRLAGARAAGTARVRIDRATFEPRRRAPARHCRTRVLQRARRIRRGRSRIRDRARCGRNGRRRPGSTSSPIRLSAFRFQSKGSGFTWSLNSRENQLTPWSNDPVSDRPGEVLYVRDEDTGELWGRRRRRSANEPGATSHAMGRATAGSSTTSHGIALDLLQYVPLEDPIKIRASRSRNHFRRDPATLDHRLRGMGARSVARRRSPVHRDRDRCRRPARCLRATRGTRAFGSRVAFADLAGGRRPGPATGGNSSAAMARSQHPAALPGRRSHEPSRGRPRSVRRAADVRPARAADAATRSSSSSARRRARTRRSVLGRALSGRRSRRGPAQRDRAVGRDAGHGPGENAGPRHGPHAQSLAALPDSRLPRVGAVGVLPGRAAPTAFATSSRTAWHSRWRGRQLTREHLLRAAARQFVRRRRPALVAAAFGPGRAHAHLRRPSSGCHTPPRTTRRDRRRRRARRNGAVSRRPDAARRRAATRTSSRRSRTRAASLFEHCARALDASLAVGAHGLPLIGTGDWNDGMNRVGVGARARASGSAGSSTPHSRPSRPLADARAEHRRAPQRWLEHAGALARRPRTRQAGTVTGIGAATSTTERRSARRRTSSAASTRSRSPGA